MRATSAPRYAGELTSAPPASQLPRLLPAGSRPVRPAWLTMLPGTAGSRWPAGAAHAGRR